MQELMECHREHEEQRVVPSVQLPKKEERPVVIDTG